jgi:transposase
LARELGIEPVFLPGYSPNLNPIERRWRFVKRQAAYG